MPADAVQRNEPATLGGVTGKGFMPGQSGNPGGNPKGLARVVREHAPPDKLAPVYAAIFFGDLDALESLGFGRPKITMADRFKAGEWLTERGYGKPATHAPIEGENPLDLDVLSRRVAGILDELADRREARTPQTGQTTPVEATG